MAVKKSVLVISTIALMQKTDFSKRIFGTAFLLLIIAVFCSQALATSAPALPSLRASVGALQTPSTSPSLTNNKIALVPAPGVPTSSERSKVFVVYNGQSMSAAFKVNSLVVRKMLDALLAAYTGKKTSVEAWRSLMKTGEQGDRIGIKVATEAGPLSGTHYELIQAIVAELLEAGVKADKITIWDRRRQDLESAGYMEQSGLRLQWMEHGSGYDPKATFNAPLIGQLVHGDLEFQETPHSFKEWLNHSQPQLSNDSHYALLLSREIDKVINVPSLCDSTYSGINGALANMTLGTIDNWRRFTKPPHFGDPAIPELYATDFIRSKVILTIMDGLALQYAGGPGPNPSHTISYGALFASRDPVALDATAIRLIEEQRIIANLPKFGGIESHVQSAESAGLGHAAEERIEVIRIHEEDSRGAASMKPKK